MIDKFDKNDGLRIFSFTVFAVLIINLLYSMLLTVFPSLDGEAGFWCVNVILFFPLRRLTSSRVLRTCF